LPTSFATGVPREAPFRRRIARRACAATANPRTGCGKRGPTGDPRPDPSCAAAEANFLRRRSGVDANGARVRAGRKPQHWHEM